jgi:Peptidase family M23
MRLATSIFFCLVFYVAPAQLFQPINYPKGYFRNPLAIPIDLSGNFGELRPNHYHMGLDFRTLQRENLPVYAAADGYIARIKIEPAGFGRAIYINHPNGYTTLYAHLNKLSPAVEAYVKQQQYLKKSWAIFLDLPPQLFPVKKGDFIANSGNTGGSQAPHLHFEIRTTANDVNVNPLLFGLPLADNSTPVIKRLALYNRTRSTYEQTPQYITLKKTGAVFTTPTPVYKTTAPLVSFSVGAIDSHNGSTNPNGIFQGVIKMDNHPITGFRMDNISYSDTRYMNAHIDYKTKASGGPFLQHLSELPGFLNSIYDTRYGNGVLDISDGQPHIISITVYDTELNESHINFTIQFQGGAVSTAKPAGNLFYPMMLDGFESSECEFFIGERCLYDSVHINYSKAPNGNTMSVSALHTIGSAAIPLQDFILVRIKPSTTLTANQQNKTVMQRYAGAKKLVEKVTWQNGWAAARFRDFGSFQLLVDEQAPVITPVGFSNGADMSKASRIVFTVKDNLEKHKDWWAELDGKWICFTNDKGRSFIYTFDEHCLPGNHSLVVSVADEAGNITQQNYQFKR